MTSIEFQGDCCSKYLPNIASKSADSVDSNQWHGLAGAGVENDPLPIELQDFVLIGSDHIHDGYCDGAGTPSEWPSCTLFSRQSTINDSILMSHLDPGCQDADQDETEASNDFQNSILTSQLFLPSLQSSTLLTWYEEELCTAPLTANFHRNPLRCERFSLLGAKHPLHAGLTISIQHFCRENGHFQDQSVAHTVISHKHSATRLYRRRSLIYPGDLALLRLSQSLSSHIKHNLSAEEPWNRRYWLLCAASRHLIRFLISTRPQRVFGLSLQC